MTKISQERKTSEGYFGNPLDPDSVGLCNQLVEGTGLFAHMYDIEETSQQTSTHQVNSNNVTLVLKPFLHCLPDTRVVVGTQTNNINLNWGSSISGWETYLLYQNVCFGRMGRLDPSLSVHIVNLFGRLRFFSRTTTGTTSSKP